MTAPIGDPKAPGIAGALEYLEARYGVPAGHVRHITITGGVGQPTIITVGLVVQREARDETVRFEPGCRCPRNAAGRVGTDPRCPMHQPGGPGLQHAATERMGMCGAAQSDVDDGILWCVYPEGHVGLHHFKRELGEG